MEFDPGIRAFIADADAAGRDQEPPQSVAEQRAGYAAFCRRYDRPHPPGLSIRDAAAPGKAGAVPIRVYRPSGDGPQGCILYLHGGGWVLGSIDTHDSITADLAAEVGATVVSVDYRLAPEHPFPAGFDDADAVLRHIAENGAALGIDPDRIVVAGDSAGGTLAAAVALAARDRGGPRLRGQALIYPALGIDFELPSYREKAAAPLLTRESMIVFWRAYLGGDLGSADPYAAPLLASDLAGLPPAFVNVAAHDPLHDDGERYAARLREAGVPVEFRRDLRLVHGHLRTRHISEDARAAFGALCAALRRLTAVAG